MVKVNDIVRCSHLEGQWKVIDVTLISDPASALVAYVDPRGYVYRIDRRWVLIDELFPEDGPW